MSLQVKICGITDAEAAAAAAEAGADLLGFVFHAPSPRNVTPGRAARIVAGLPAQLRTVAVMLHPSQSLLEAVCSELSSSWLQLDAADLPGLKLPGDRELLPVYRDWPAQAGEGPLPPRLLYESARSGSGLRADWQAAARLARRSQLFLAGGLTAGNVAEAIVRVRPCGVDVSSGVERAPGRKDPARILEFIAAARAAASQSEEDEHEY